MKIIIDTEEKKLNLRIPTFLVTRKLVIKWILSKSKVEIDKTKLKKFISVFKRIRKKYKNLEIISVKSSDGEIVRILLWNYLFSQIVFYLIVMQTLK